MNQKIADEEAHEMLLQSIPILKRLKSEVAEVDYEME